jgi:hypothetical protein
VLITLTITRQLWWHFKIIFLKRDLSCLLGPGDRSHHMTSSSHIMTSSSHICRYDCACVLKNLGNVFTCTLSPRSCPIWLPLWLRPYDYANMTVFKPVWLGSHMAVVIKMWFPCSGNENIHKSLALWGANVWADGESVDEWEDIAQELLCVASGWRLKWLPHQGMPI